LGAVVDAGPRRDGTSQAALEIARGMPQAAPAPANAEDQYLDRLIKKLDDYYRRTSIIAAPPAHNEPHFYSWPVDISGRVTVPAAVGDWQTVAEYTLENGRCAVINGYGMDVRDAAYDYGGSLLFQVTINGRSVPTLQDFATRRGTLTEPRRTFIKMVQNNDVVRLQVRRAVAAAASQDVDACLVGWTWRPTAAADGSAASLAY
jgi:hypothetical protein